jgi:hypothetical protein
LLRNPNKLPLAPCAKKKERFACLSKLRQTNFNIKGFEDTALQSNATSKTQQAADGILAKLQFLQPI